MISVFKIMLRKVEIIYSILCETLVFVIRIFFINKPAVIYGSGKKPNASPLKKFKENR